VFRMENNMARYRQKCWLDTYLLWCRYKKISVSIKSEIAFLEQMGAPPYTCVIRSKTTRLSETADDTEYYI
jgi:hypothetical protein